MLLLGGCGLWAPPADDPLERVLAKVEAVRGIQAPRPIDARVVGQDELRAMIRSAIEAHRTPEEIHAFEEGLVTVGLWPADRPLLEEFVAVMTEELAGLYLVDQRALVVPSEVPQSFESWLAAAEARQDPEASFALAHELVHLLQHRAYPELFEDDALYFGRDDLGLAVQTAIEGDAMYFGLLAEDRPLPPVQVVEELFGREYDDPDSRLAQAPRLLRELVGFPYARGYALAHAEGGALLEDPPASTEQALHPERRNAEFTVYDLAGLLDVLPPGCARVFENGVGELQLRVWVRELSAGSGPDPLLVADGWDGDRYLALRCAERRALVWLSSWDDAAEAAEFASSVEALTDDWVRRAGLSGPLRVERAGRDVLVASPELAGRGAELRERVRRGRVSRVSELRRFADPD